MKSKKIINGLTVVVLISLFIWITYITPIELFEVVPEQVEMSTWSEAPVKTAEYLWNTRLQNTVSQALVVFTAVVCALALLREVED